MITTSGPHAIVIQNNTQNNHMLVDAGCWCLLGKYFSTGVNKSYNINNETKLIISNVSNLALITMNGVLLIHHVYWQTLKNINIIHLNRMLCIKENINVFDNYIQPQLLLVCQCLMSLELQLKILSKTDAIKNSKTSYFGTIYFTLLDTFYSDNKSNAGEHLWN